MVRASVGGELFPPGHSGAIAQFSCGTAPIAIRGAVIVSLPVAPMSTFTLPYSESRGKQKPERFLGGERAVLELSTGGGPYEQAGLKLTATQTNEEKIEVNSVV
jgi:hypothetical protein